MERSSGKDGIRAVDPHQMGEGFEVEEPENTWMDIDASAKDTKN